MHPLLPTVTQNLSDILNDAILHTPEKRALLIFDEQSDLARLLTEGYKSAIPSAECLNFDQTTPLKIREKIDTLSPGDLVVLIQSTSFRLNEFRFRLELFNRNLAAIEHPHLGRMPESEHETFVNALAYDKAFYHSTGKALRSKINAASTATVFCEGTELNYTGPFEPAKLNIGDYTELKNTGGQFPIGEVFTELQDLSGLNGQVKLFAFGDRNFRVEFPETPILLTIEGGFITKTENAPEEFLSIVEQIDQDEKLSVRELGFGMNRALTRTTTLSDVGSYERMCGIHLSIGGKHTIYTKEGYPKSSKYHVDVFVDVTHVEIDGERVFEGGRYLV